MTAMGDLTVVSATEDAADEWDFRCHRHDGLQGYDENGDIQRLVLDADIPLKRQLHEGAFDCAFRYGHHAFIDVNVGRYGIVFQPVFILLLQKDIL